MQIALIDGTWLEGRVDIDPFITSQENLYGLFVSGVHRSNKDGESLPLAQTIFLPLHSILFVITEE